MEWRRLALETPTLWSDIKVASGEEDALEALLLLSKGRPLDIVLTGVRAPRRLLDVLILHTGRIRCMEVQLYEQAMEPFQVLGCASPDGFSRLSRLSIEDSIYNASPQETLSGSLFHPLERARRHNNTFNEMDLRVVQSLPMVSSLTALVINDAGTTTTFHSMKDTPSLLQNLTCHLLETLDVVVDDLSKEGWWDLLCTSLTYPN